MQTGNRQPAAAHAGQETSRMRNRQPAAVRAEQETNNLLRYGQAIPGGRGDPCPPGTETEYTRQCRFDIKAE